MAFHQLYYTSCENGLAGYGGYQFNAVTPGVSPMVMREVEDRTVYEPPRGPADSGGPDEPDAYPVAFSHTVSEATGATVTAHVVFAGTDYSGRPGNYFAHALVTDTPREDFGPLLPVELWGARLWRRSPVDRTELPALPGPPPRGVVDRPGAQAFLDARQAERLLPVLLSAVGRAMAGDRPVLLASQDADENVWWIATVSYLLGDRLSHKLTFTTYSHRPGYSRHHVIGIPADVLPPDADSGFQLFDVAAAHLPGGDVHPLAALLARVGVMSAAGLWQQASAFASGAEQDFDDWLAPVAAAAALLGGRLSPDDVEALARWLPAAVNWLPAEHADIVLGVVLAQPDRILADGRLRELLELARRLPAQTRVDQLERLLVERAFVRIAHGGVGPGRMGSVEPVRLTGPSVEAARIRASRVLGTAAPPTALAVLEWTAACGVVLPDAELERYGRTTLDLSAPASDLTPILTGRPAILRGLIARLATEPVGSAETLLGGPVGELIERPDLAAHPKLTELWLLLSAGRARIDPLRAFDEIVDVRDRAGHSPRIDGQLLGRLWPKGCPPDQIVELLGIVTGPPAPDVLDWFAKEIVAASRDAGGDGWLQLVQAVTDHPLLPVLPERVRRAVQTVSSVAPLLRRARAEVPGGDTDIFAELYAAYANAREDTRRVLRRDVPPLLIQADPLGRALRDCPTAIVAAFSNELTRRLSPLQCDARLAARVFVALDHLDVRAQASQVRTLESAFGRVAEWRRRDLGAIARALKHDPAAAERFQAWRDERRGGLARKLKGFGGRVRPSTKDR